VRGPISLEVQANVRKNFRITERAHVELKMAAPNLTNSLPGADPSVDIANSGFGGALRRGANLTGPRMEFELKILF
jgi:hypothetical protein